MRNHRIKCLTYLNTHSSEIRDIQDAAAHEENNIFQQYRLICLEEMQLLENTQSAKALGGC